MIPPLCYEVAEFLHVAGACRRPTRKVVNLHPGERRLYTLADREPSPVDLREHDDATVAWPEHLLVLKP